MAGSITIYPLPAGQKAIRVAAPVGSQIREPGLTSRKSPPATLTILPAITHISPPIRPPPPRQDSLPGQLAQTPRTSSMSSSSAPMQRGASASALVHTMPRIPRGSSMGSRASMTSLTSLDEEAQRILRLVERTMVKHTLSRPSSCGSSLYPASMTDGGYDSEESEEEGEVGEAGEEDEEGFMDELLMSYTFSERTSSLIDQPKERPKEEVRGHIKTIVKMTMKEPIKVTMTEPMQRGVRVKLTETKLDLAGARQRLRTAGPIEEVLSQRLEMEMETVRCHV